MSHANSILVLGAGELGMAMLRSLAHCAGETSGVSIAALLRPSAIDSQDLAKQKDIAELRSLGIGLLPGDLSEQSKESLAAVFERFHTVISCTGFVGGSGYKASSPVRC